MASTEGFKVPPYLEQVLGLQAQNRLFKVLALGLLSANVVLGIVLYRSQRARETIQPLIVAVDPAGKWHVREAGELVYTPSQELLKYFLTTFIQAHFGRVRATVRREFARSIAFLDEGLAEAVLQLERKTHGLERFLADGSAEEREIDVSNIALEERTDSNPVYHADITYDVIYSRDHRESRREHHLLRVAFLMKLPIPVKLIPVNPLGFVILTLSESGPEQK